MRYVYAFEQGSKDQKFLLGGKGANLAEMTNLGLPVPPGFTITTDACKAYMAADDTIPDGLLDEVAEARAALETKMGKQLGDPTDPLLVSVRSGAAFSMPGMMDTVLNLGLNDVSVGGLAQQTANERFAWDSYRRFVQMFGKIVLDIDGEKFEHTLTELRTTRGVDTDPELSAQDLRELVDRFKAIVLAEKGIEFPQDPQEQLRHAIEAVFRSWNGDRARVYRRMEKIPDDLGTAVNVQSMVFGNKGDDSGTGVAFTRDPATGENKPYGDFLANAQGEDVVAGIRVTQSLESMAEQFPRAHAQLLEVMHLLEQHYRDMCDIEFTVEQGHLYMLQVRVGKRTAAAALKLAVDMEHEGLIDEREAVLRVAPEQLDQLLHPQFDPGADVRRPHQGAQRVAGRRGRQGLLHGRRRGGTPRRGRGRHPRPPRDVARRHPRDDRGRRDPHLTRGPREPRGVGRTRVGQAGRRRRQRARHRRRRPRVHGQGHDRARRRRAVRQRHDR